MSEAPAWFAAAIRALSASDVDGYLAMYDDDAVHEFPFGPSDRPSVLEGKPAITDYMRRALSAMRFDTFELLSVHETDDGVLIVEAAASGDDTESGEPFGMRYVWFISHTDGHVTRFRDYHSSRLRSS